MVASKSITAPVAWYRHWWKFVVASIYVPVVTLGEWIGFWSLLFNVHEGEVRVNLLSWLLLLIGPTIGAILVYLDVVKERDNYWAILCDHYGIKAVLNRLRDLNREGVKIRSSPPPNDPFSAPRTKAATDEWRALFIEWRTKVREAIGDLCPEYLERFNAIDDSKIAPVEVHNLLEIRKIVGVFDQYLLHLNAILADVAGQPKAPGQNDSHAQA